MPTVPSRLQWGRGAGVIRLGGPLVSAHLLIDREGLILIDAGLWGIPEQLRRVVAALGRQPSDLRHLILTHGHLDHAGGAAEIQAWSGARVWLHAADHEHVGQRVRYRGGARLCGALEYAGRRMGGYRSPEIGGELIDGDCLPFWGGLRVWHLPGHTPGHCALVAERSRAPEDSEAPSSNGTGEPKSESAGLIFTGDLFASYAVSVHRPPFFLTRDHARAEASLRALAATRPTAVLPSHYDHLDPALHARRLARLVGLAP